MMGGVKSHYDCVKAFSETDFTEDLKRIDVPTLIASGPQPNMCCTCQAPTVISGLVKENRQRVAAAYRRQYRGRFIL
jgi:non-heme chloroperoxidase